MILPRAQIQSGLSDSEMSLRLQGGTCNCQLLKREFDGFGQNTALVHSGDQPKASTFPIFLPNTLSRSAESMNDLFSHECLASHLVLVARSNHGVMLGLLVTAEGLKTFFHENL